MLGHGGIDTALTAGRGSYGTQFLFPVPPSLPGIPRFLAPGFGAQANPFAEGIVDEFTGAVVHCAFPRITIQISACITAGAILCSRATVRTASEIARYCPVVRESLPSPAARHIQMSITTAF